MKKCLVIGFIVFVVGEAFAQAPNCSQTVRLANSTYEQGRLHELPGLLENCLKSGFTQTERVQAYRLLTLAYIYLEEQEKADGAMLSLLQTDNYFQYNPAVDPAEFAALYKTFRTTPIYRLGVKAGTIASQPNVTTADEVTNGSSSYKYGFGFTGGIVGEIPINSKFTINPELNLQLNSFKYSSTDVNDFLITASHSLSYLSLPISLHYYFIQNKGSKLSKFNPYVSAGVSTDYLIASNLQLDRKRGNNRSIEQKSVKLSPQREKINVSGIVSAGMKFRVAGGFPVAEGRDKY